MAFIVNSKKDMVGLFNQAIANMQVSSPEMVIVPVMECETAQDAFNLLC